MGPPDTAPSRPRLRRSMRSRHAMVVGAGWRFELGADEERIGGRVEPLTRLVPDRRGAAHGADTSFIDRGVGAGAQSGVGAHADCRMGAATRGRTARGRPCKWRGDEHSRSRARRAGSAPGDIDPEGRATRVVGNPAPVGSRPLSAARPLARMPMSRSLPSRRCAGPGRDAAGRRARGGRDDALLAADRRRAGHTPRSPGGCSDEDRRRELASGPASAGADRGALGRDRRALRGGREGRGSDPVGMTCRRRTVRLPHRVGAAAVPQDGMTSPAGPLVADLTVVPGAFTAPPWVS